MKTCSDGTPTAILVQRQNVHRLMRVVIFVFEFWMLRFRIFKFSMLRFRRVPLFRFPVLVSSFSRVGVYLKMPRFRNYPAFTRECSSNISAAVVIFKPP